MSETPGTRPDPDARPQFAEDEVWTVKQYTSAQNALRFYRVLAFITGTMLLILTVEMVYKYLVVPFLLNGNPSEALIIGGFNLASAIAICHGWCYVVYLIACYWLNSVMRWSLGRFLILALAGVVPVMSFILERRIRRQVDEALDAAVVVAPRDQV